MDSEILEIAADYLRRGLSVIPIPERSKKPAIRGWQKKRLTEKELPQYFNGKPQNIGVLLGEPSGGLVDVDLDHPLAIELAPRFLPQTMCKFGRASKPISHWIYRVSSPLKTHKRTAKVPRGSKAPMLVEIRSTGTQTVFPGSVHPSGEEIEWHLDGEPREIDPAELRGVVDRIADAVQHRLSQRTEFDDITMARLALAALNPARADAYDEWICVGMCLHSISDELLPDWIAWSRQSQELFKKGECEGKWNSFSRSTGGRTIATLIHMAKEDGWIPPRRNQPRGAMSVPHAGNGRTAQLPNVDSRREIIIGTDEHRVNDETIDALNNDAEIFQRAGRLVWVTREPRADGIDRDPNAVRISPIPEAVLRDRMTRVARFQREVSAKGDRQVIDASPPQWCVQCVAQRGQWPNMRKLNAVVSWPILRPDGSVHAMQGYDPATRVYVEATCKLTIPADPCRQMAIEARDEILEVVCDFPFEREEHKAAWLSGPLTMVSKFAFADCSPLILVDAPTPGSGKGLAVDAISMMVTGRRAAKMSAPKDDDEFRKKITSIALAGDLVTVLDNVTGELGCESLDSALTTTVWWDRLLGRNERIELPLHTTWLATGNNIVLRADTSRRVLHVRLNPLLENPEERSGFRHSNLLRWTAQNRDRLVSAALTILIAYYRDGRPDMGLPQWGSFENWSNLVRNALVWVGMSDPALTKRDVKAHSDIQLRALRALIASWTAIDPDKAGLTSAEILQRLNDTCLAERLSTFRAALLDLCPSKGSELPSTRALSKCLSRLRQRVVTVAGSATFIDSFERQNYAHWHVREAG